MRALQERSLSDDVMDTAYKFGYTPQELAPMVGQYARSRGFMLSGDVSQMPSQIAYMARLGIDPSTQGRYQGLAAAGIGATGGDLRNVAGLGWTQGLRDDRLVEYISRIASNTESLAAKGIEIDQAAAERFIGRMQATPGLRDQGVKQLQGREGLQGVALSARDQLRAPFAGYANALVMVDALEKGGGIEGADERVSTGDLATKAYDAIMRAPSGGARTMAMRAATGLAPAQADAFQVLAQEPAKGDLPSRDEVTFGLRMKSMFSLGETGLLGIAAEKADTIIRRKYMTSAGAIGAYDSSEDVLEWLGTALRDIADALGHWDRNLNRDGTLRDQGSGQ